jgi:hypothetical protein
MKPCKYCKEKEVELAMYVFHPGNIFTERRVKYYIHCPFCKARGPLFGTQSGAIRLWNGEGTLIREDSQ